MKKRLDFLGSKRRALRLGAILGAMILGASAWSGSRTNCPSENMGSFAKMLGDLPGGTAFFAGSQKFPTSAGRIAAPAFELRDETPITLASIPEPGVLLSLAGGTAVLLGFQRFRRRSR
jgi:hypothetical protein